MRNSVATPATYALETIIYAQTIPLGFSAVVKEKGKAKKGHVKREPLRPSRIRCSKMKVYIQPFPAPHGIESYAPGIPTAGPSSGFNQYGGYSMPVEATFGCDIP